MKIKSYYFSTGNSDHESSVHVKAFSHSFVQGDSLRPLETLQIDLTKDANTLLMEMQKTTRRQIRRAEELGLDHVVIEKPSDQDLQEFQGFYNRFAKNKKTHTCNSYHMKTMGMLRDRDGLMLTYMRNKSKEIICYRVYITDEMVVMNLYSASHFRTASSPELKKMLSHANRLLLWKSILWFKEKGYELYDVGGLTNNENIRNFKLGFGGEIVSVYSGYEANSFIGSLILKMRSWKIALATAREIQ